MSSIVSTEVTEETGADGDEATADSEGDDSEVDGKTLDKIIDEYRKQ